MTTQELQVILEKHKKWLNNEEGGERADLQGANLWGADLRGADLRRANLQGANLWEANLQEADLWEANLQEADLWEANLRGANLQGANLWEANLRGANLQEANLWEANLRGADLRRANLQEANLQGANLQEANLEGAVNIDKVKGFPYPDLYILKSAKGTLRAYKLVNEKNEGIFNGGLRYEIGKVVEVKDYDEDERVLCSKGINVATLTWCKNQKESDTQKILEVEFEAKDIVAIPYATDGKFRVRKCKVLKEVQNDF